MGPLEAQKLPYDIMKIFFKDWKAWQDVLTDGKTIPRGLSFYVPILYELPGLQHAN